MNASNNTENIVTAHYEDSDRLKRARALAENPGPLTTADLSAFDEMHVGGYPATSYFLKALDLQPGMRVLDIGSGLGGAARHAALQYKTLVSGVDLTPGLCDMATRFSEKSGLAAITHFQVGSALVLPFPDATFDRAFTIHTCMNIDDKSRVYAEALRALKPGGLFGIYDVMRGPAPGAPSYPMPWADEAAASFLITPDATRTHLTNAGFSTIKLEDRTPFGIEALSRLREKMPDAYTTAMKNLLDALETDLLVVTQITARAPSATET